MLTTELFIGVVSLCATFFGIGLAIGYYFARAEKK